MNVQTSPRALDSEHVGLESSGQAGACAAGRSRRRRPAHRCDARPQPRRGGGAAGAAWSEPAQERARDAVVEAAARAVRELPRHHPAGRHRHFGDRVAAAGSARERAPLRGDRHHRHRGAQRAARLLPGSARGALGARPDGARGARILGDPRRRAPARRRARDRARRHRADRGRRQDPGRRPHHRGRQPAHRRGAADRREPAGREKSARRSRPPRASAIAATCSIPAPSRPTAAAAPSWWRPAWKPRSDASPACSRPPRRNRRRCSRSSTAPVGASPS